MPSKEERHPLPPFILVRPLSHLANPRHPQSPLSTASSTNGSVQFNRCTFRCGLPACAGEAASNLAYGLAKTRADAICFVYIILDVDGTDSGFSTRAATHTPTPNEEKREKSRPSCTRGYGERGRREGKGCGARGTTVGGRDDSFVLANTFSLVRNEE